MPFKDIELRRIKARKYQQKHRARKKLENSLIPPEPRFCLHCNESIVTKRKGAKFCSRLHKTAFHDKHRDGAAEYAKNSEKRKAKALEQYYKNIQKSRTKQLERQKQNLPAFAAATAKRRAIKLNRTPAWISEDELWLIREAHKLAALRTKMLGIKFHVDHIIPLQGKLVSGLHVPNNLQVIPAALNISKNNFYEVM